MTILAVLVLLVCVFYSFFLAAQRSINGFILLCVFSALVTPYELFSGASHLRV